MSPNLPQETDWRVLPPVLRRGERPAGVVRGGTRGVRVGRGHDEGERGAREEHGRGEPGQRSLLAHGRAVL